jgi:pyruvate formate lyase activating enzyme
MVFDVSRYAIHDGPGIRTTVFLKGCPLSCWWCHNPEGISREPHISMRPSRCIRCGACVETCPSHAIALTDGLPNTDMSLCDFCLECAKLCCADAREIVGRTMSVEEVMFEIRKDVPFYDESGGGVTFSGGEPLMQPAFLMGLLKSCGEMDIHRTVDTSGYAGCDIVLKAAGLADLVLYDLKHMDPAVHRQYTGASNEIILDNLRALSEHSCPVRVRIPLIPGINDDPANIERTAAFVRGLKTIYEVDLLPYHNAMAAKYRRFGWNYRLGQIAAPDYNHIRRIAETLGSYGLRVTIGGNDHERACPETPAGQP